MSERRRLFVAYVIMRNDYPEHVVLNDEALAEKITAKLARETATSHGLVRHWHIEQVPYTVGIKHHE